MFPNFTPLPHARLQGNTCYISRIKDHGENIGFQSFSTLHSIVYKILRLTTIGSSNTFHDQLCGEMMMNFVTYSLHVLFKEMPSDGCAKQYYNALRQHLNGHDAIMLLPRGMEFLQIYLKVKESGLDWEETFQLATYYLKNSHMNTIEEFKFNNLILLNMDRLLWSSNKNARLFFNALYEWNLRHRQYNIYILQNKSLLPAHKIEPVFYSQLSTF